jgi:hypothetical protein
LCFLSAGVRAGQGDATRAAVLFALGAGTALHPGVRSFHQIGHTQVYWRVLPILYLLIYQERWTAAAICLGLLASARTPLLALAPVLFIHLYVRGALTARRGLIFIAAVLLPYLPFLIADPGAVKTGMVDTYMRVMKAQVWPHKGAVDTFGVTGRLLEYAMPQYIEAAHVISLGLVYVCAWRALARRSRIEPWLPLALLAFAMTTLWSVVYLFYDVWLFLTCALLVYDGSWNVLPRRGRPGSAIAAATLAAAIVVLASAAVKPGARFALDIGAPGTAGYTGGGFGADVAEEVDGRSAVWIEGASARIRLPRAGWTGATIRLVIRPNVPYRGARQTIIASLNGQNLGGRPLVDGWQEIAFRTERAQWIYGFNVLDLFFAYAAPLGGDRPSSSGARREIAAALDVVSVE